MSHYTSTLKKSYVRTVVMMNSHGEVITLPLQGNTNHSVAIGAELSDAVEFLISIRRLEQDYCSQ